MRWSWALLGVLGMVWVAHVHAIGQWPVFPMDHSVFWGAAQRVMVGNAALIYDGPVNDAYLGQIHGTEPEPGLRFPYLPNALPLIAPLAFLPFWASWAVFVGLGMAAVYLIVQRLTDNVIAAGAVLAIGGPIHAIQAGQNGFYIAAFLGGGMLALRHNKVIAGVAIGLLTLKPHFAVVAFLALLWWREWKALAVASGTALILLLLPAVLFGPGIYLDFLAGNSSFVDSISQKRETLFETMHQSVFALALRHTDITIALIVHVIVGVLALTLSATIRDRNMAIAAVIAATLIVAPYSLLYDSTALLIACALLIRRNSRLILPLAALIGFTGIWFVLPGSIVPIAALAILAMAKLNENAGTDAFRNAPLSDGNASQPGSASA